MALLSCGSLCRADPACYCFGVDGTTCLLGDPANKLALVHGASQMDRNIFFDQGTESCACVFLLRR
jgi:hypothetical protein